MHEQYTGSSAQGTSAWSRCAGQLRWSIDSYRDKAVSTTAAPACTSGYMLLTGVVLTGAVQQPTQRPQMQQLLSRCTFASSHSAATAVEMTVAPGSAPL